MSCLIEGLPDDVALRCLALVPFYLHPKLELVSQSWRSVIRSGKVSKAREEVGSVEDLLFVCCYDDDNTWQFFDPLRELWITLPRLPSTPKGDFSIVSISQKLFVLGGICYDPLNHEFPCNDVWSFDPVTRNWSMRAPMLESRTRFACAVLDGKIIVVGGLDIKGEPTYKVEMYCPELDLWIPLPNLPVTCESYLACFAAVVGTKMHLVYRGSSVLQTFDSSDWTWTVEDYSWFCQISDMVPFQDSLYVMSRGCIFKLNGRDLDFFARVHEFQCRDWVRMICFRGKLYVIGGFLYSEHDYESLSELSELSGLSDVNVLSLGGKEPAWISATPMSRGSGVVLGCAELRI